MLGAGLATSPVENAADEVPHPTKKRVLMRKARDADVYWSTLGIAERSGRGSASHQKRVLRRKAHRCDVYWST